MSTTSETIEDDRIVAKCYVELGNVTKEKGDYDESLRYHRKSMEIFERIDDTLGVADVHLNIAEIYKAKGELKQAMSEYEKGLTLYEDVLVDDVTKNSDSGTDNSLNSSSISDLQHSRQLSKSEEALPQTSITDIIEKPTSNPLNDEINPSNNSTDLLNSSINKINNIKDILIIPTSLDDSVLPSTEKIINEPKKSLSSLSIPELLSSTTENILLSSSHNSLPYQTTSEESGILDKGASLLLPIKTDLHTNSDDTDNNNQSTDVHEDSISNKKQQIDKSQRLWHRFPFKKLLIVILTIFFTGVLFWSLQDISIESLLSYSSNDSTGHEESRIHNPDDLTEQFRKILTWRKDRLRSLSRNNRRAVEEFLTRSYSRTEMSVEKFEQLLDLLDLKIVLIPK